MLYVYDESGKLVENLPDSAEDNGTRGGHTDATIAAFLIIGIFLLPYLLE